MKKILFLFPFFVSVYLYAGNPVPMIQNYDFKGYIIVRHGIQTDTIRCDSAYIKGFGWLSNFTLNHLTSKTYYGKNFVSIDENNNIDFKNDTVNSAFNASVYNIGNYNNHSSSLSLIHYNSNMLEKNYASITIYDSGTYNALYKAPIILGSITGINEVNETDFILDTAGFKYNHDVVNEQILSNDSDRYIPDRGTVKNLIYDSIADLKGGNTIYANSGLRKDGDTIKLSNAYLSNISKDDIYLNIDTIKDFYIIDNAIKTSSYIRKSRGNIRLYSYNTANYTAQLNLSSKYDEDSAYFDLRLMNEGQPKCLNFTEKGLSVFKGVNDVATEALDVNGNIKVSDTAKINKIKFSDNSIQTTAYTGGGGTVTSVTASLPLSSSDGTTPNITADTSKAQGNLATFGDVNSRMQKNDTTNSISGKTTLYQNSLKVDNPITQTTWTWNLSFNNKTYLTYASITVTSSTVITISSTGKIDGATEIILMIGDGTNSPNFSNCTKVAGSPSYNSGSGIKNLVIFTATYDSVNSIWIIWYNIIQS